MRFSDSIQYDIPKLNKYATYDSSPFNSDDPLSEDTFSQEDLFSSQHNPLPTPTLQENSSSNDSGFQPIKKTHQPNPPYRTQHPSQNDIPIHHNPINQQTKTHYSLRLQPRKDYR